MVTYYVGGHEAIYQADGSSEIKRYIRDIAIHSIKNNGNQSLHYVFNDHLGSGSVITDANGNVVETASFDAFGKRRNANSWQGYANPFSQLPNLTALLNLNLGAPRFCSPATLPATALTIRGQGVRSGGRYLIFL